jgi:hypothetical protein
MNEQEFTRLLRKATNYAYQSAKEYVSNTLIEKFKYDIQLNQSHDISRQEKFAHYPEDNERSYSDLNEKEIVSLLFRSGKIPVWIDINVKAIRKNFTIINLLCAGRYSDDKNEFYYEKRGTGPFSIKSPNLPHDFQERTKFSL